MMQPLEKLALAASIIMPLWNIPLIVRIIRRKSSEDLSLAWFFGVWVCMLLMLPWAVVTKDTVLKVFSFVNASLFSVVGIVMIKYYPKKAS
ncbi:MAG: hypothetical protein HQL18_04480 [Candidatus Omnitrophica bacterium]|nr:hypothetical protein [Candidatus Omnitrophota bacterium]